MASDNIVVKILMLHLILYYLYDSTSGLVSIVVEHVQFPWMIECCCYLKIESMELLNHILVKPISQESERERERERACERERDH